MARVEVTTAGHTIIVESDDGSLDALAAKALELWTATRDPQITRGFGTVGFTTDRSGADGTFTSGHDSS